MIPNKTPVIETIELQKKNSEEPVAETQETQNVSNLSASDQLWAGTNLVQWGLIGASYCGVSPTILMPLSVLTSLGSEIIAFCSLPKDASWLRKAMSIPVLSKAILNYNPWVAKAFQAISLYNLVRASGTKLKKTWNSFQLDPAGSLKAGAVHLFNLASGVMFAAESAGLIRLSHKDRSPPENTNSNAKLNTRPRPHKTHSTTLKDDPQIPSSSIPAEAQSETLHPGSNGAASQDANIEKIRIKIATVYNNHGDLERDKVSQYVISTHDHYAKKWGLERDHISDANGTLGQCTDPSTGKSVHCSPYFEKIYYLKSQCQNPDSQDQTIYLLDDDMPITNVNIHPFHAWRQLRINREGHLHPTQIIVTKEEGDWPSRYPFPGYKNKHRPLTSVNTGFIGLKVLKDGPGCQFIEKVWEHRNTPMDPSFNSDKCPTIGFCQNHGVSSLGDQTAWALAMQKEIEQDPGSFFEKTMSVVDQRDEASPYRSHIALNTLHRDGCRKDLDGNIYDIGDFDRKHPKGMWQRGDWMGQPAGFKLMGKYPLPKVNGQCVDDPNTPMTNTRLKKVMEMTPAEEYDPTILMTYTEPPILTEADRYSHISEENARTLAHMNRAQFKIDTKPMDLTSVHPHTGKEKQVVPYWRKVKAGYDFVHQPEIPGKRRVVIISDNDGLFNPNLDLYQLIKTMKKDNSASVLVADDISHFSRTNTGLLIIEQTPAARNFMKLWLDKRDIPSFTPEDPECPTHALCVDQRGGLHEQSVLNKLLEENPRFESAIVKVMPYREKGRGIGGINTYYREKCMYDITRPKQSSGMPYVAHYDPIEAQLQPDRAAVKGDAWIQAAGVPKKGRFCYEESSANRALRKEYLEYMQKNLVEDPHFIPQFTK